MALTMVKPDEMESQVGTKLPPGEWFEVDQERINTFADCTEDHQFIHIDSPSWGLMQFDVEAKGMQFLDQNVEGFRDTSFECIITSYYRFVDFGTTRNVIRFYR